MPTAYTTRCWYAASSQRKHVDKYDLCRGGLMSRRMQQLCCLGHLLLEAVRRDGDEAQLQREPVRPYRWA